MKIFGKILLGVIFMVLIVFSVQHTSAEQNIPIKGILASEITELVTTQDSKWQIYLQLSIRNVDGQLINVTESTAFGAYIEHTISDHVFDTLMVGKEIVTVNGNKYEKAQWEFNPSLEHRFVGLYPIYSELTFDESYESIANFCPENVIVSNGLSKWCGAGGWRFGYFVIPNELNKIKNSMKVLASETFSAVSAPIQFAAISAFNDDHKDYILKSKKILKAIGEYVYNNLKSNNVLINPPQGGFYIMPEFLNSKFRTSSEMCEDIIKKTGVALLPGSDFGFKSNKMLTRLSFTDFDGENFLKNVESSKNLDDDLIKKYAPNVVEGTKRLAEWSQTL